MDKIFFSLDNLPEKKEGLTLALGNFDGFHLGHQSIANETRLHAIGPSGILFFKEPYSDGPLLSDLEDKIRFSFPCGLDCAYCLENDRSFYELNPSSFMDMLEKLGAEKIVCGPDFSFGKDRLGNPALLKTRFDVEVIPFLLDGAGAKISSSAIKKEIAEGDLSKANRDLGRNYETKGTIVHGLENGRRIGFPTLNLEPSGNYVIPKNGVYAGIAYLSGIPYKAMINVGTNPTIGTREKAIEEAHLFGYKGDAYGKRAYFQYLSYLREERKFASLDELKKQLESDKEKTLAFFERP